MPKIIWIDNNTPPTNCVWMKTDLNDKLIGVYEYIKDKWREIDVDAIFSKQYYTKWDVDFMLKIAKQEILQRIASGSYDITEIVVDSELNSESTNPVSNNVLTAILNSKQDKIQNLEAIREGAMRGKIAYVKPSTGIRKIDLEESLQRALTDVENVVDVLEEDYYTKEQITDLLSAFIDNAVDNLVNYYTKSEIDSKLSDKQATLVSGENIKTINGQSIVGSGNITLSGDGGVLVIDNVLSDNSENAVQNKVIKAALDTKSEFSGSYNDLTDKPEIKSRKAFKSNWPTSTTLNAFCQAVINDSDAKVGEAYLGSLSCSGLPSGLWIGDTVVEVIGTDNNKVVKLTVTSTEVAPYHWEASYWQGSLYGWRSFELDSNKVTSLSSASTNAQYPSAKLVYDQLATKQATISDLADIRSGAGLGATAYQKPQTGIPASDLAPGVIPSGITLLELSSDIGTLTSEQLALVQTNNCVIKYTGNTSGPKGLYHKSYDSTEGIDYNKIQETKSNDNVRSYYFTCIKETGEYNFGTNTDARPRVVGNPTIQEGTTPPTLMNLRIGFTDYAIPQGGGSDPNAIHFTQQSLTTEQQVQARNNIGAGTYSKPSTGIPTSDLASGVIPTVPTALSAFTDDLGSSPTHTHSQYLTSHQDISGKQDIYSVSTSQIANPKEGDITVIAEEVKAEDLQDSENLSNISPNGGNALRIKRKAGSSLPSNCGKINIQGSYWGMFSGNLGSIELSSFSGSYSLSVIDASGAEHTINQLTGYDLSTLVGGAIAADSISLTEVIGDGEQSLLPYVKIDSVKAKEIWEYKDGAWVNRRDFPTTFDNQPTAGSTSLVKSGGIATAIASKAQSYSSDPSSQPSSPKEGDIWDSPLVNSLVIGDLIGSFYRYMPDSHYQTKIVISSETPEIYVTKADDTIETIIDDSVNPKFYPAGEVKYVGGYGFSGIYNYQPAFCKVYHNDAWVDADSMFIDVEANPTVPSGTTPTDLTGLKVGNGYFGIPSLPTIDNTPTKNSTNLVKSGGVYSEVHPAFGSSQPAGGMLPNVVYDLGELTGSVTFALASPTDNTISNPYHWTFDTGSTAPYVNWPSGVIWPDNVTPTVDTGKHYEVLVRNGYGSIIVYTLPSA